MGTMSFDLGFGGDGVPVFVGFTEREDDVLELVHDVPGSMVHELQRALVVWLHEVVLLG